MVSLVVDIVIFSLWCAAVTDIASKAIKVETKLEVVAYILVSLLFIRVLHVILFLLYLVFVLPCYYMPDCCIFKQMLVFKSVSKDILEQITETEWLFTLSNPAEVIDTCCLICLQTFKTGDLLVNLPCVKLSEIDNNF